MLLLEQWLIHAYVEMNWVRCGTGLEELWVFPYASVCDDHVDKVIPIRLVIWDLSALKTRAYNRNLQ
jgi:hypothetical protein